MQKENSTPAKKVCCSLSILIVKRSTISYVLLTSVDLLIINITPSADMMAQNPAALPVFFKGLRSSSFGNEILILQNSQ
jgi:hypothetical protein